MSRKRISSFFKPPEGMKRKENDDDDDYDKKHLLKKHGGEDGITTRDYIVLKMHILALSKANPAVSSNIGISWFTALSNEFDKEYFKQQMSKWICLCPRCEDFLEDVTHIRDAFRENYAKSK